MSPDPSLDDRMHRLIDQAVDDVEPGYGLDRIRARTARSPRRGWAWGAGAAGLAAVWINRTGDPCPDGVTAISTLAELASVL